MTYFFTDVSALFKLQCTQFFGCNYFTSSQNHKKAVISDHALHHISFHYFYIWFIICKLNDQAHSRLQVLLKRNMSLQSRILVMQPDHVLRGTPSNYSFKWRAILTQKEKESESRYWKSMIWCAVHAPLSLVFFLSRICMALFSLPDPSRRPFIMTYHFSIYPAYGMEMLDVTM